MLVRPARSTVLTRRRIAFRTGIAILPGESSWADATVSQFAIGAHAAIVAGRALAKVDFQFAVTAHVARLAVASVVVDQLDAVQSSSSRARIGETFVDVAFASRPDETGRTLALESADLVDASASVVTGSFETLVDVDLAEDAQRSVWTGAREGVDQVVTDAAILARIRIAVVDVVLAIGALETGRASA